MKISKRLKEIADLVDNGSNIIDVGCDHALLDIYLVNNKNNIKVIASDNKKGPLEQARKNISSFNLENKIKVKYGDGLDPIEDNIDTVIIAGMGGNTIIDILSKKENLKHIKTLIISPQSEVMETRKFLMNSGFKFIDEKIINDQNKYYFIMKLIKEKIVYSDIELFFGPILLKNKSNEFYNYYESLLNEYKNNYLKSNSLETKEKIKMIEDVLRK